MPKDEAPQAQSVGGLAGPPFTGLSLAVSAALAVGCPLLGEMPEGSGDLSIGSNHGGQYVTDAVLAGDLAAQGQTHTRGCEVAVEQAEAIPPAGTFRGRHRR